MAMDTPEKTIQITTPLSKFEESPVFSYINSLSPIKPVKSIHVQTFQSLSFASLPSIFTSPHVSSHKESRFLKRHSNSDLSKLEFSPANGIKICTDAEVAVDTDQLYDNAAQVEGSFDPGAIVEASVENSSEHLKFAIELPQNLKYDCGSPDCDPTPRCGNQADPMLESAEPVPFVKESSQNLDSELHLKGIYQIERKKEATECDWENLISDASDVLIFNSPIETEALKGLIQKSLEPVTGFCTSFDELHKMQIVYPVNSGEQYEMEDPSTQPGETIVPNDNQNKFLTSNMSEEADNEARTSIAVNCKAVSNLYRGMRRRCLDFEMVGARKKNGDECSSSSSSILVQSDEKIGSNGKELVPLKPDTDSSRRLLPGIGLHLNALAIASKDSNKVKHETLSSGISLGSYTASFHSPTNGEELDESLPLVSTERDLDPSENGIPLEKDVSQAPAHLVGEEFNQSSPKKKRRKLDGEGEACKRCNCKKSKCLKLYCECFAAGVYCIEPCSCQDCYNKPIHEDTVLATRKQIESRNPLAFAPKVIRSTESVPEIGDESSKTPASARHKRGCNCKKSSCLKKYCECYQGGVGCSINCRCEGCKNAFGRKDGSTPFETEAELEDETEACEKAEVDQLSQKNEIQNNDEQNPNAALPTTPLQLSRTLVQLPFSSSNRPPRSFLGIGSSSGLYTGQKYGKPNIIRPQSQLEKQLQTVPDDDIPEILRCNYSPTTGIKTSSPNSKRVSPPLTNLGSSPGLRSGRKLILQSIPSFPSLTPQH